MQARSGSRLLVIVFLVLVSPLAMRCHTDLTQIDLTQTDRGERSAGDSPMLWSPRLPPPYFPGTVHRPAGVSPRCFPVSPVRIGLPQITRAAGTSFFSHVTSIATV